MPRRVQQMVAHRLGEMRGADALCEQAAIHIGEGVQFGLQGRLTGVFGRIENIEQIVQHPAYVAAIGLGVIFDKLEENVFRLEYAGIIGKQAEQQTDQQLLQIMPDITGFLQCIVQLAHQFRRLDGDARLRFKADLAAQHEIEFGNVLVQIGQPEFQFPPRFKVQQHP